MSIGNLIEELIELKISGEPEGNEWMSIADCSERVRRYHAQIADIRAQIDAAFCTQPAPGAETEGA